MATDEESLIRKYWPLLLAIVTIALGWQTMKSDQKQYQDAFNRHLEHSKAFEKDVTNCQSEIKLLTSELAHTNAGITRLGNLYDELINELRKR